MKKSIILIAIGFDECSEKSEAPPGTEQFAVFFRTFKKELTKVLTDIGCTDIQITKGFMYCSGFFTCGKQIWYINYTAGDETMMFRIAKSYKDFTGGSNQWIRIDEIEERLAYKLNPHA